ncbi:putative lipoxygenase [Triangularia setosa]|uniref:Manganese lipoxygenase n=1 Tax=Triangularia setosa TaxID=2587417 RepID=A0AAN6VYS7_9PEZI|nr:putative lipoxygenase [Podospora setosa]
MSSIVQGPLPIPPPSVVEAVAKPEDILAQPDIGEKNEKLKLGVGNEPLVDIDPGVFDNELIKLGIYSKMDPDNREADPVYQDGDVTKGTYTGTQAALIHAYGRIERSYETYFDALQIEPTLPRYIEKDQKKELYQWSDYPTNRDGTPAQYPPHLQTIPREDQFSQQQLFNGLGLANTIVMIAKLVPDTWYGKTVNWGIGILQRVINGDPMDGTLKEIEEYNRAHRKSGTDIEQGNNIGLLPDWFSDRRFADQSFTGTNPTSIAVVPDTLLGEFIAAAKKCGYDKWAAKLPTIDPKTLFVQDARDIRRALGVEKNETLFNKEPKSDDSWGCAAVTLFQLHPTGELHPVAIVIDYKGDSLATSVTIFNQRILPSDPTEGEEKDWPWRYAKTCAQVTDFLRHEVSVHLTQAHLIEEALIVATNRTVPMEHIIYRLLSPHWYKTLSLNAAARATLVPQIIKDIVGVKPDNLYQYVRSEFESFDYVNHYIPNDLARRGFPNTTEGLAAPQYRNYAYAKNMVSMWYCIRKYVRSMLLTYYVESTADDVISNCDIIKAWYKEVQTAAHIKTFPTITTLDELTDAITMSIHIAAPFHSAVNYLQNFYQVFVVAKPPCLCSKLPATLAELKKYKEADLVKALPIGRQRQWLLAAQIPWLLSFKVATERSLISFARSQWWSRKYAQTKTEKAVRDISETFHHELRLLDVQFAETSNAMSEGSIPYMVMDPDNTAVSILI